MHNYWPPIWKNSPQRYFSVVCLLLYLCQYKFLMTSLVLFFMLSNFPWKMVSESMEEELLPRSTIVLEANPLRYVGDTGSATSVLVLSTMVALCGSLCSGCAVSAITNNHFSYMRRVGWDCNFVNNNLQF